MPIHLRSTFVWLAFAAAACGLAVAPAAEATPVTYGFAVHVYSGPLAGTDESGTFSYDSGIAAPDAWLFQKGLLSAFDFSFNGRTYDVTTVDTQVMTFDEWGNLRSFVIGNACDFDGFCGVTAGQDQWWIAGSPFTSEIAYSVPGFINFGWGTMEWSQIHASVAEPGTLGLFGLGLLFAGAMTRRRLLPAGPAPTATSGRGAKCGGPGTCG